MPKQPQVDVILVGDNNDVTKACIKSIQENTFVPYNIIVEPFDGYNKSLNEGAKKGNAEYIAFCNNDLVFHKNWFYPLAFGLGMYSSVSPWCDKTHNQWWLDKHPESVYSSYEVGKCIAGWFIMMERTTWESIGGFDERFEFWYADNAYAEQIKEIGYKHALIYQSKVTHLQSTTLNKKPSKEQRRLTHDQTKLFKKLYK